MQYYSEEECDPLARDKNEISKDVWRAIALEIRSRLDNDWFAWHFPQKCADGPVYGTNLDDLAVKLRGQNLAITVPLDEFLDAATPPETLQIFALIRFCFRYFVEVAGRTYEYICGHHHFSFVQEVGQIGFREEIQTILRRNNLAFTFTPEGQIKRVVSEELAASIHTGVAPSGDPETDRLLAGARGKILDMNPSIRRDASKDLGDAWERLKSLYVQGDNLTAGVKVILDAAAGGQSPEFRQELERDATALTDAGNAFTIRHSKKEQEPLVAEAHVDYLFHRLYAMIDLVIWASRNMQSHTDKIVS